jgi:hypothetical protein
MRCCWIKHLLKQPSSPQPASFGAALWLLADRSGYSVTDSRSLSESDCVTTLSAADVEQRQPGSEVK